MLMMLQRCCYSADSEYSEAPGLEIRSIVWSGLKAVVGLIPVLPLNGSSRKIITAARSGALAEQAVAFQLFETLSHAQFVMDRRDSVEALKMAKARGD